MSTGTQIEQRLATVENAVCDLQRQFARLLPTENWLEQITGSFKYEPAFDEILEFGRAMRLADRLSENAGEQG